MSAWDFFKHVYIIRSSPNPSLFDERIAKFALTRSPISVTPATPNSHLASYYFKKGIFDPAAFDAQSFAMLATHRFLWEKTMLEADSLTPFWVLIMEDSATFHPLLTDARLHEYLTNLPSDALFFKLGYLAAGAAAAAHTPANRYWVNFNATAAYSTVCYAVRSDLCPALLKHRFISPLDWLKIPHSYGAADIEDIEDIEEIVGNAGSTELIESYKEFRQFSNPVMHGAVEEFRGIVSKI